MNEAPRKSDRFWSNVMALFGVIGFLILFVAGVILLSTAPRGSWAARILLLVGALLLVLAIKVVPGILRRSGGRGRLDAEAATHQAENERALVDLMEEIAARYEGAVFERTTEGDALSLKLGCSAPNTAEVRLLPSPGEVDLEVGPDDFTVEMYDGSGTGIGWAAECRPLLEAAAEGRIEQWIMRKDGRVVGCLTAFRDRNGKVFLTVGDARRRRGREPEYVRYEPYS